MPARTDAGYRINPALCALVGYSAEELLARNFQAITHPDDLAVSVEQVRQLLAGEIPSYELEKRYLHREGHPVWVHATVSVVRHHDGAAPLFIAQVQDLTDRRRTEQALRDSEARYRRIVELAHEGIWVIDAHARTTFVNPRMAQLLGYSVADIRGRHLSEFMDKDGRQSRGRPGHPGPAHSVRPSRPTARGQVLAAGLQVPLPRRQRPVGARVSQPDPL